MYLFFLLLAAALSDRSVGVRFGKERSGVVGHHVKFRRHVKRVSYNLTVQPENRTVHFDPIFSGQPTRVDWNAEVDNCISTPHGHRKFRQSKLVAPQMQEHFAAIMRKTAPFRNCTVHSYGGYSGPWIENLWIDEIMNALNLTNDIRHLFPGGVVPLLIQWTDCRLEMRNNFSTKLWRLFELYLRKDVLYVTVSQHDTGIFPSHLKLWNIFTFSAGGYGHVPIPLLSYRPPVLSHLCGGIGERQCTYSSSFMGQTKFGTSRRLFRRAVLGIDDPSIKCCGKTVKWLEVLANSSIALCPRGYGRSSFRLYESIQMGVLPLYIYDDIEWLPYAGTHAHLTSFGFSVNVSDLASELERLKFALSPKEVTERRKLMLSFVSSHYTLSGVIEQIITYIRYGTSVSDLRCSTLPSTNQ